MPYDKDKNKDANRDPITKTPGAHPVGTGIGAAAGGAAAGAAVGSVAGPAGTAAGIVGGAIVGGLAGKGVAEAVNPTEEEAYWRERHAGQPYARNRSYDEYQGAYRTGWEGYSRYGISGRSFQESEADLRREYERNRGKSTLGWDDARFAAQAAWQKLSGNYERISGYEIQDSAGNKIGSVHNIWIDHTGQPAFLGVKTGWLGLGRNHVVPVHTAQVNDRQRLVRLPFSEDQIKNAPAFDAEAELSREDEQQVYRYYGVQPAQFESRQQNRSAAQAGQNKGAEAAAMQLSEEEVKVGKREVSAGGVRLRKIVRTETVQQPVELKREEIVIERVPASGNQPAAAGACFQAEDVFIPLRREEAVVQKEARVREEVRASKRSQSEQQQVSESVRKEDVEIEAAADERGEKPRFSTEPGSRHGTERYEPKERGKQR
jgi:uncharacterized protein (TIGR02271 family)